MRVFFAQCAWLLQRAIAIALPLALGVALLRVGPPLTYERWHALATSPHGAVVIILAVRRKTVEHPFGTLKAWMGATHFPPERWIE